MDIASLKDYIIENGLVNTVLESIGCHSIRDKGAYVSAANPDGDNVNAISVYKDNLHTVNYTRNIGNGKRATDIFDLVSFAQGCDFFNAVKFVCDAVGISVYHTFEEELPESVQITKMLMQMIQSDADEEETRPLKPIPETILTYFDRCSAQPFCDDNISDEVQKEMEIGYDQLTNRITLPIRDEYGTLVGIKGRLFSKTIPDNVNKYVYIEKCNRSQILYGLFRAKPFIRRTRVCYVVESEKGVMQGLTMGIDNIVAVGGKKVSRCQFEMLSRLGAKIVICFDKDVELAELHDIADKFVGDVEVEALVDNQQILEDKESPTDDPEKFYRMISECRVTLRTGGLA